MHIANIGLAGFPVPELYNIDFAQVEAAAKAVAENADIVIGVKVRMSENVIAKHGLEPLKRAIQACEIAGGGAKIMCHIGGVETPELMSQILDTLRPGDVLTHGYSGAPNIAGKFTNIVQDGKLLPAALAAKQRGVMFDVGHGGGSFDYTVAEAAMAAGAGPDTISSDIHVFSGNTPGMPYLTWVMSKFLNLGFSLEQVVAMATVNPAKVINRGASSARCRSARRPTSRCWKWSKGRSSSSTRATTSARARSHQAGRASYGRRALRPAISGALCRALNCGCGACCPQPKRMQDRHKRCTRPRETIRADSC